MAPVDDESRSCKKQVERKIQKRRARCLEPEKIAFTKHKQRCMKKKRYEKWDVSFLKTKKIEKKKIELK
jgi:hypothetical protein